MAQRRHNFISGAAVLALAVAVTKVLGALYKIPLGNLLDNARRYNVNGGMIRISAQDNVLSVKDTGIGIPKEHQSRIFERFYRVDKSHSRATGGTGLGLSIVKHVAELHQATVELESTEHIGTEIRVCFPR